jgi:hypothetical protein
MARHKDRNGDDPIMVCVMGHAYSVDGQDGTCADGVTYRASHPAVRANPRYFLPWANSTTHERQQRRAELMQEAAANG